MDEVKTQDVTLCQKILFCEIHTLIEFPSTLNLFKDLNEKT